MADKQTIEQRIAHFLRLAEDEGATQHERDLASEQAERLMIKHGIEETMLNREAGLPKTEEITTIGFFFGGAYGASRRRMVSNIAHALKMKTYYVESHGMDELTGKLVAGFKVTVVGFESDVAEAKALIRSLDLQASIAVKQWAKTDLRNNWWMSANDKTNARREFIESFGLGVGKRIKETRQQVIEEVAEQHAGTALVLVDREQAVKDHVDSMKLRKGRASTRGFNHAGYSAGMSANTGTRALGSTKGITR